MAINSLVEITVKGVAVLGIVTETKQHRGLTLVKVTYFTDRQRRSRWCNAAQVQTFQAMR